MSGSTVSPLPEVSAAGALYSQQRDTNDRRRDLMSGGSELPMLGVALVF
jgi:hypothetical protein